MASEYKDNDMMQEDMQAAREAEGLQEEAAAEDLALKADVAEASEGDMQDEQVQAEEAQKTEASEDAKGSEEDGAKTAIDFDRERHTNGMHRLGRIFTWIAAALIVMVPVFFGIGTKAAPDWKAFVKNIPFMLGFIGIGLVEAISYAPLLGTGGQYLSFITGNISNLKLPCAINAQSVTKVELGTEEHEIVTTIAIAVSSIVTTLIIVIGLIPLAIYQEKIVETLKPISPYVMPAIFGGLTMVLIAMFWKNALIPFVTCCIVASIMHGVGKGSMASAGTMVIVGMVISMVSNAIMYKKGWA